MRSNLVSKSLVFNFSVWFILMLFIYDFEIFFLTIVVVIWHLFKGVSNILNDYVYAKPLKLILLFVLQISLVELGHYFIDFLL